MLEEMDVLFGGVNHVEKGGAQMSLEDTHHASAQHVEGEGEGDGKREREEISEVGVAGG